MESEDIAKLRISIRNYIERHHFEAAEFWGDKVVSVTGGAATDVYWLAQTLLHTRQYHRACLLINKYNLTSNGSLCYLAALCHFKMREHERALDLLESSAWPSAGDASNGKTSSNAGGFTNQVPELDDIISLECSRQVLRAQIYESIDNSNLATECYQAALKADPLCYDALKALTDHHMLTIKEKKELHDSLPISVHCKTEALRDLVHVSYDTKISKGSVVVLDSDSCDMQIDNLPAHLSCLSDNLDVLAAQAERFYYKCHFVPCFQLTKRVLEEDPYHTDCLPIHIACLIELQQPNTLFLLAHKLVDLYPELALSWFAVGCYYYLIGKNEPARRYLSKAASINKVFGPAWIAFAHSFAAEKEHDQASAAYFKAANLMKGSHLPLLYIGMEYNLSNNNKFAQNFFEKAIEMAPDDPFVLHELGVVNFNNQQYEAAEGYFMQAMDVIQNLYVEANDYYNIPAKWTALYNNLAHTLRKLGKIQLALQYHSQAVMLSPSEAICHTGMALCHALLGEHEAAVDALHVSLSLQRDQTVATTLLTLLMERMAATQTVFPEVSFTEDLAPNLLSHEAFPPPSPPLLPQPADMECGTETTEVDQACNITTQIGVNLAMPISADLSMPIGADNSPPIAADLAMPISADMSMPVGADLSMPIDAEVSLLGDAERSPQMDADGSLQMDANRSPQMDGNLQMDSNLTVQTDPEQSLHSLEDMVMDDDSD
ncbi:cell division cycle protein 16 homolog [Hyalella azteca]|uniref:Cell division cycle protein 16 homolog n=1 Tax=Hyalella azteca TaxID=294128 RepID=A0A8B7PGM9_HYAAZ|nr:cell division cycle protein 16 homolog [Hyalella azteca]